MVLAEDSGLSTDDQVMLASLFSDNPAKAAAFRALSNRDVRDKWVERELNQYQSRLQ